MAQQQITYDVIGKAVVERGGGHIQHALKLLYKGDGTPWWTCNAGLELAVNEELYSATEIGQQITMTVST